MADAPKGIMRSLGEFFGHIARGVASDPGATTRPPRTVVHEETTEREETTVDGQRVILRRTVVEEIEVLPDQNTSPAGARCPGGASPRTPT